MLSRDSNDNNDANNIIIVVLQLKSKVNKCIKLAPQQFETS